MYPRSFEYVAPASLDEALEALASHPGAKVLAGGHSLLPLMKLRLLSPELLVDIGRVPDLDGIVEREGHLVIGANVTHARVAASAAARQKATALWEAASWVGDPQVRNRGTVCGSLAHADPASDEPAAALALGAVMVARSRGGAREIPATEFFVDTMLSALREDEILTEVRVPVAGAGEASAYDKLGRRGGRSDYAVAGAAVRVRLAGDRVDEARVALTGVGTVASLAAGVEEELAGGAVTPESLDRAVERTLEGVTVIEDLFGSAEYKAHLARVYVRRALAAAVERARS